MVYDHTIRQAITVTSILSDKIWAACHTEGYCRLTTIDSQPKHLDMVYPRSAGSSRHERSMKELQFLAENTGQRAPS